MKEKRYSHLAVWGLIAAALPLTSCRQNTPKVETPQPRQSALPKAEPKESKEPFKSEPDLSEEPIPEPDAPEPDAVGVATVPAESDWLHVDAIRPKVDGGWATGDFFEPRNKIEIHTRGVKQFSLDLSKLNINWDRLVIIGIDGRNAELRKRNADVIHIARDKNNKWVVREP